MDLNLPLEMRCECRFYWDYLLSFVLSRLAYRSGVTSAITSPTHRVFISGLGTAFSTGASHRLENGAVIKDVTGVHVSIHHVGTPSVSTQVATLRALLSGNVDGDAGEWFKKVVQVRGRRCMSSLC